MFFDFEQDKCPLTTKDPVNTGRKLNVHKTFRRRPASYVRLIYVLCLRGRQPQMIIFCEIFLKEFKSKLKEGKNVFETSFKDVYFFKKIAWDIICSLFKFFKI